MEEKTNILIVDDDLSLSYTTTDILDELGYKVAIANNGYEAIEMVKNMDYDMILMDIKMPGINGVETLVKLKYIKPSVKVIMMTAYSVEDLIKEALKEGAYGIIYKPIKIKKLLHYIEKIEKETVIVIIDDETKFCETFKNNLEEMKYKITTFSSGVQAIRYVEENDVDIIFIDAKMPVLNGLETYLALKKINPDITAVMVTGYGHESEIADLVERALSETVYACLYKPLDMNKVISLINEISRQNFMSCIMPT